MKETERINRLISLVLKISSGLSMFLMLSGFILYLANHGRISPGKGAIPIGEALAGALRLDPFGLMAIGIVVLISTPFFRVIGAFFSFVFFEKDKVYGLISLGVLAVLILGLFIPGLQH